MSNLGDEPRLSVLDLPQLHRKPSTATLLDTLSQLAIHPSSFNEPQVASSLKVDEAGVTGYLTRFIASPLAWITSEKEKEEIWEAASQRLSERSGRMAMSSISRTFTICDYGIKGDGTAPRYIAMQVNEPSLTEDNVGHKTWTGSFLLAKRLPHKMIKYFPTLLPPTTSNQPPPIIVDETRELPHSTDTPADYSSGKALQIPSPPPSPDALSSIFCKDTTISLTKQSIEPVRVLELGSGTGLTGIAAAALFPNIAVHLTDLPSIVPNLVTNVETNAHLFVHNPTTAVLDWSNLPIDIAPHDRYDCILAADSLYDPQHPDWLTDAMLMFLNRQKEARIIVELPFRDMDLPYHDLLRNNMDKKGFVLLEEGKESGYDDWEGDWCERMTVVCWWSVWGWAESQLEQAKDVKKEGTENQHEDPKTPQKSEHDISQKLQEVRGMAITATPAAEPTTGSGISTIGPETIDFDACPMILTQPDEGTLS